MLPALHGHTSDSPALNLLYMLAFSLLCQVHSLNRITCPGLFSLWRLSDWLEFGCCCFLVFLTEGFDGGLFISVRGVSATFRLVDLRLWLPCKDPGRIGSALGLVGPVCVSVWRDWYDCLDTCCLGCLICMCFVFLYLPVFSAIEHVSHGKVL